MINIFKKRARLCALTTGVFLFLQGVYVYAESEEAIEVSSVQGRGVDSPSSAESPPAAPANPTISSGSSESQSSSVSSSAVSSGPATYKCEPRNYTLNQEPLYCVDGKEHTMKVGSIVAKKNTDNAVYAMGFIKMDKQREEGSGSLGNGGDVVSLRQVPPITMGPPITIEKTTVTLQRVSILGAYPSDISSVAKGGRAVVSTLDAEVKLENSNIRDFAIGLEARTGAKISMKNGAIRRTYIGAVANLGSSILLDKTSVDLSFPNKTNIGENEDVSVIYGLYSLGRSDITMKSGSITIAEPGIGVVSESGGSVVLEKVAINIKKKESEQSGVQDTKNAKDSFKNIGFLLDEGFVSFNDGTFDASDASALLVTKHRPVQVEEDHIVVTTITDKVSKKEDGTAELTVFGDVDATLSRVLGQEKIKTLDAMKISAGMKKSKIKVSGENSYGISFVGEKNQENTSAMTELKQEGGNKRGGARVVFLQGTNLETPEGVAVYAENFNGYVVLEEKSKLAGDLFLQASSDSKLSVFSNNSIIIGGARISKDAGARIFLSGDSKWYLAKSKNKGERSSNVNCVDSCISSMVSANSLVKFTLPKNGAYQTLRIGKGEGTVYTASGDTKISFNVGWNSGVSGDVQMSDRLLIHGDVAGQTKVFINDAVNRQVSQGQNGKEQEKHEPYSISIIQVYGSAAKNSFQLNDSYVTIPGSPYQYILRAYGPTIAPYMRYFDKQLVKNDQVWDFRLESKIITSEGKHEEDSDALKRVLAKLGPLGLLNDVVDGDLYSLTLSVDPYFVNKIEGNPLSGGDAPRGRVLLASSGSSDAVSSSLPVEPSTIITVPKEPAPIVSYASVGRSDERNVSAVCDIGQNGAEQSQTPYFCNDGKLHTMTNLTLNAADQSQYPMHAKGKNTVIKLEKAVVSGVHSFDENDVGLTDTKSVSAVLAEEGAEVVLKESTVQSSLIGSEAQKGGKVKMDSSTINVHYVGALAGADSSINLTNTKINVVGDLAVAGLASNGGEITMDSGAIALTEGVAVRSESGGHIQLNKVDITAKKGKGTSNSTEGFGRAAFLLNSGGSVDFINGSVVTDAHGLWIRDTDDSDTDDSDTEDVVEVGSSRRRRSADVHPSVASMNPATIESSTVKMEGDRSYGIYFDRAGQKILSSWNEMHSSPPPVVLKKTNFEVPKSIAIYGNNSAGYVSVEEKATLSGDLLLRSENNSRLLVAVSDSIIKGGARIDNSSRAQFSLEKGSEWLLTGSQHEHQQASSLACSGSDSCISSIHLRDSAVKFVFSASGEYQYQTLRIGRGSGEVYWVEDAHLYLNTYLNKGGALQDQKTDRVLIHGDVSGKTTVHIRAVSGSPGGGTGVEGSNKGISIIQVSGKAEKASFQLDGGYVALENLPYKYVLRAYGPESELGKASAAQRLVEGGGEFWDFRLENGYIDSKPALTLGLRPELRPSRHHRPEIGVKAVVPQVPTYLILPNGIFHAGLMDISNHNKQLEALRTISSGMVGIRENPALYSRGYGGRYRYTSDLSTREYGYGGDLNYNGIEAGVLLQTIENVDSTISFGVMGSYGKLSLQPQNVDQSQKSSFDKWTGTAYGSMQHGSGFYVDGLLSYGFFTGDVLTSARGKTATLKGNPLSVSLTGGQTFATGYKGFVFDPQVQVVYQHLQFNKARDIDNFDIEMGKLDQWVARVGGRLVKIPIELEGMNSLAFYGKLYFSHGFGKKQSVRFKDAFQLGGFGSSLEAGLGFNARLSGNFVLQADMIYQHKLTKAGFSGASFSGGVRYQF